MFLFVPELVAFAFACCFAVYLFLSRRRNFWKNQGVVQEDFSLIFGPTTRHVGKPASIVDQERYNKMGRVFGIYEGGRPALIVAEPNLVKQVLVTDFTTLPNRRAKHFADSALDTMMVFAPVECWKRIRPAASPAFSIANLRKITGVTHACAKMACKQLVEAAKEKKSIDLREFYGHYSLNVAARCGFSMEIDSHHEETTKEFVKKIREGSSKKLTLSVLLKILFPAVAPVLGITVPSKDEFHYFKTVCQDLFKRRQADKELYDDFLELMIKASATDSTSHHTNRAKDRRSEQVDGEERNPRNKTLTSEEALAQCTLYLFVVQDNVARFAALVSYLLAVYPHVQERLRKEVDECIETHGPEPSLDVIFGLKYLHCVTSEAMRLYPSSSRIERRTREDYVLGDTNILIPKGCIVAIPVYAMHRDPQYFPDPELFDPDRFSEENAAIVRPYTYLPFGAGPRNCIGSHFALQALKICLLHAVHHVEFVRVEETQVPLEIVKGFGAVNFKSMRAGIRCRRNLV